MKLCGRRALVTGGGRGIGRATALLLAREGADVAVCSRTAAEVEEVAGELRAQGRRAFAFTVDVSSPSSVRELFATVRDRFGAPDILVNGAGVAPTAPLVKTTDEMWHQAIATNLSGAFYCLREALPAMAVAGWGRVVNVASIAGKTGQPYIGAYAASKHGLLGLTKCAAMEVAQRGVTVNAVCPGYVDTPMTDAGIAHMVAKTGLDAGVIRRKLEDMSPQKRMFTADEVAALVLFLCTDEARGINGQGLSIDGGAGV